MRIALASARVARGADADEPLLLDALRALGADAEAEAWDADVAWEAYDLVVLRSTWDYPERLDAFLAWLANVDRAARVHNPVDVVRHNTDKRYLADLDTAGVPTVPTTFVAPGEDTSLPVDVAFVVKPAVSAGSRSTIRCRPGEYAPALALVKQLHREGRTAMIQPYVGSVDERGETAMIFIDGQWSHACRKGPLLVEGTGPVDGLHAPEQITRRTPTAAEHAVAESALAALNADDLLYARVDLVTDDAGLPMVLEVELTEPSLFLREAPEAIEPFARAIVGRVG